jgi:3-oxoacyl-[acyl-carrier protein] reductase
LAGGLGSQAILSDTNEQARLARNERTAMGSDHQRAQYGSQSTPAASAPTSVSRAAGMALTKVLAGEGGAHNILVNALLVGLIVSDQWVKRHAATAPDIEFGDFTRNLAKGVPLGRMGTAEVFANLACFLASDLGSNISGTAINVDGGRSPVV